MRLFPGYLSAIILPTETDIFMTPPAFMKILGKVRSDFSKFLHGNSAILEGKPPPNFKCIRFHSLVNTLGGDFGRPLRKMFLAK